MTQFTLSLEHAITYTPCSPFQSHHNSTSLHIQSTNNQQDNDSFIYIAGASVCLSKFSDAHEQEFLRGHDDRISTLTISRSGDSLASGQVGENADVCVWDLKSRTLIYRLDEHEKAVSNVAFTNDELLLASVGMDMRLLIWDMTSGYVVSSSPIKGANGPTMLAWGQHERDIRGRETRNYQLATSTGNLLLFWILDPFEGKLTSERFVGGQNREHICLAFSNSGDQLITGNSSGDISIFSIRGLNLIQNVQVCSLGVQAIYISKDDKMILAAGGDGTLTMLQQNSRGQWICTAKTTLSTLAITALSVSDDEKLILIGSKNGDITRLNINSFNKPILHCQNHFGPVLDIQYPGGDNDHFATCSLDNTIRLWDAADYSIYSKSVFKPSDANPRCLAFVNDVLFSGWSDGSIRSTDPFKNGDIISHLPNAHKAAISSIVGASNAKFFVTGGEEGSIRVWEIRNNTLSRQFNEHQGTVTRLRMFKDDIHVLSSGKDKRILCWDMIAERCVSTHMVQMGAINDVVLLNNQNNFITVGANKSISLWDIRQVKPIRIQEFHQIFEPTCIAVASNDLTFAVGGTDEIVHLYDVATGKELSIGEGHSKPIHNISYSPDDKQLVSVGEDGCVFVWNQFQI